jgi:hypothetical protein
MPAFSSPFLEAVARPRKKGFAEQILDDITNISAKQALALPLTLPATAGAGAIEGLSFGLLSPTDELETFLGEYAPPKPLQTAAEIAGTIGGSFVPYIGASSLASKMFTGIGVGQRLARGAITFGAPELLRQALTNELDPLAGGRSLATGAAFSLPLPRYVLAPAVAATELLFGAEPIEAGVSAGFAALFGSMGPEAKKIAQESLAARPTGLETEGLLGELVRQKRRPPPFTQATGTGFAPSDVTLGEFGGEFTFRATVPARPPAPAPTPTTKPPTIGVPPSPLTQAAQHARILTKREREALATGQIELPFSAVPAPKSQVELIFEIATKADTQEGQSSLRQLALNVQALSKEPEELLSATLVKAIDTLGPDHPQTKGLQFALAEKRRAFVPQNALVQNPLKRPVLGVETIETGPTNPFEMRARYEDVLATLRQTGGLSGKTKAAQLEDIMYEARQEASQAKVRGQGMTPQRMAEIQAEHDRITASRVVTFRDDAEALKSVTSEMSKTMQPADVDEFVRTLPPYYQREPAFMTRVQQAAVERKKILQNLSKARAFLPAETPEFAKLRTVAADYGAQAELEAGRVVLRHGGQEVRSFRSPKDAEARFQALETGETTPLDPIRLFAGLRHQLTTTGTIRGWHGTSAGQAERILAEGFKPFDEAAELTRALKDSGLTKEQWAQVPQSLRNSLSSNFFGGVGPAQQAMRAQTFFTSDPSYAGSFSASGGEYYAETLSKLKDLKQAMEHGYVPQEGKRIENLLLYLDANNLRRVKGEQFTKPLQRAVIAADVEVPEFRRANILAKLDEALANPPQDEKGLMDVLSRLFTEMPVDPKKVKIRRVVQDPQNVLRSWEMLPVEGGVNNVQELRLLAHSRGMVVDFDGKALNITNQMTGETIQGLESLKEAAEAVRSAPNVAVAAREIGPRVPGAPSLPGAGSLHGLGTEQPPPFCPLQ